MKLICCESCPSSFHSKCIDDETHAEGEACHTEKKDGEFPVRFFGTQEFKLTSSHRYVSATCFSKHKIQLVQYCVSECFATSIVKRAALQTVKDWTKLKSRFALRCHQLSTLFCAYL